MLFDMGCSAEGRLALEKIIDGLMAPRKNKNGQQKAETDQ